MTLVKEALTNLAQTGAKMMVKTNPALISFEQVEGIASLIVR